MVQAGELRLTKSSRRGRTRLRQFLGWCVHFYTALGLVAAAGIAVLIVRGGADSFRWAFVLMVGATLIDATDGLVTPERIRDVLWTYTAPELYDRLVGHRGWSLDDYADFVFRGMCGQLLADG